MLIVILFFTALFYIAIRLAQRQLDPFRVPVSTDEPKYVRRGGVLVDVFEYVVESNRISHVMDLDRADWETRADACFELTDFDTAEYEAMKNWLGEADLSHGNNELIAFVEQEVKAYAKKTGVVRIYIDQFSTFVSPVGEPFVRITIYEVSMK